MRLFTLLFTLVFAACGSSKKSEVSTAETLKPDESNHHLAISVNVDGNLHEWPEPLPGYSKETSLHFGVTDNKDFLFIAVACNEDRMQRKMLRAGMEIYISENGKKETLTGIAFPLPSTKTNRQPATADEIKLPEQNAKDYKSLQSAELTQLQTFGFKKTADGSYPLSNPNSIKVAYTWSDNNFFNIEYAIPLKELFTDASANNNIQVGFKLNGFSSKDNNPQGGRSNGVRGGGGMRGGSGMRGGGMRGGGGMRQNHEGSQGMNNMSEISKDQSFWIKYTISTDGK